MASSSSPSEGRSSDDDDSREASAAISDALSLGTTSSIATEQSPPSASSTTSPTTPKSALDILQPKPWVPPNRDQPKSEIAGVLEQLTKELIEIFRDRDWSNPLLECMVANFSTYIDFNETRIKSVDAHMAYHQWMYQLNPGYSFDVESVSADVNEEKGTACVWALLRVTGHPQTIKRESMTLICWRRSKGKWRAYKQVGIRGVNMFSA